jgi:AcrR family transcriptional regulator
MTAAAPLRADAARNRVLVLAAAQRLFAQRGLDVSMQEIAAEAGVGVGTIFRRFPTKDHLVDAIVDQGVTKLLALAERAVERATDEPWEAFAGYFTDSIALYVRHRGFMEAIGSERIGADSHAETRGKLLTALRELVATAQVAGVLRADMVAEDLPGMQCAISRTSCMLMGAAVPDAWRRACSVFLDGLRVGSTETPLEPELPAWEQLVGQQA